MKHLVEDLIPVEVVDDPLIECTVSFEADPALNRRITWHTQRRAAADRRAHQRIARELHRVLCECTAARESFITGIRFVDPETFHTTRHAYPESP